VFCVVSRYHGGAFVVFSGTLNEKHRSGRGRVLVGVGHRRPTGRRSGLRGRGHGPHEADPRLGELQARIAAAESADATPLRAQLATLRAEVRAEKLGAVADEFEKIHSIKRGLGSRINPQHYPAARLRPYLIDAAVERGVQRTLARHPESTNPPTKERFP